MGAGKRGAERRGGSESEQRGLGHVPCVQSQSLETGAESPPEEKRRAASGDLPTFCPSPCGPPAARTRLWGLTTMQPRPRPSVLLLPQPHVQLPNCLRVPRAPQRTPGPPGTTGNGQRKLHAGHRARGPPPGACLEPRAGDRDGWEGTLASGRCERRSAEKAEKLLQPARARLPQAAGSPCGMDPRPRAGSWRGPSRPSQRHPTSLLSSWVLCTPPLTFPGAPPEAGDPFLCALRAPPRAPSLQPRGRPHGSPWLPGDRRVGQEPCLPRRGSFPLHTDTSILNF